MNEYTSNNLYAAEEWDVIFNAFRNISIQAFEYHTIHNALENYIKTNNPEEYQIMIKNGIMGIHMDMISRLCHSLSYRYELMSRENFFDTAVLRESVIKLAKAFAYRPKRNRVANGLCRIAAVRTTEPLLDSDGNDLSNQTIRWNQSGDANWLDKFQRIMNKALTNTNPIGRPLKRESIYNVQNELYAIDRTINTRAIYPFNAPVNGTRIPFEAVSCDIRDSLIIEDIPNPISDFKLVYRNDRNGNFSENTGFFIYVKEGSLQNTNYSLSETVKNRQIDITNENINETDVWVVELDENNQQSVVWESVNNLKGQSVDFQTIFNNKEKLYTIETLPENGVSIHFGDGTTAIPKGNFRIWYRSSRNEFFTVKEREIFEAPIQISYQGNDGQTYQVTLFLTNENEIANSEPEESVYRIKRNAPLAHYTQDRMINSEDYNIFPQTRSSLIQKQKTVNRTHPGHSRYMDIYDESNEISFVTINTNDGYIFTDNTDFIKEFNVTFTTNYENEFREIINETTTRPSFKNYTYYSVINSPITTTNEIKWKVLPNNVAGDMGYFTINDVTQLVGKDSTVNILKLFQHGTILTFKLDDREYNTFIETLANDGVVNPFIDTIANIRLGDDIPDGAVLENVIPNVRLLPNDDEIEKFAKKMEDEESFNVYYNFYMDKFDDVSDGLNVLLGEFIFEPDEDDYGKYVITTPNLTYNLGSNNNVRFFYKPDSNLLDPNTLLSIDDFILIEDGNSNPDSIKYTFLKRVDKSDSIVSLPI